VGMAQMVLVLPILGGCQFDGAGPFGPCDHQDVNHPEFTEADSAGIRVLETACALVDRDLGWTVEVEPDLQIGGGEDPDTQFSEIRGVAALADGGVAVVDLGTRAIRYFDDQGEFVHQIGREGSGPGEFGIPRLVSTVQDDSLVVWDWRQIRFTVLSNRASDPQLISMGGPPSFPLLHHAQALAGDQVLVKRVQLVDPAPRGDPTPRGEPMMRVGLNPQVVTFSWVDVTSGKMVDLVDFQIELRVRAINISTGTPYTTRDPFTREPHGTTSPSGAFIVDGRQYEILHFDTEGALERILRVDRQRRPVSDGDFDTVVEQYTGSPGWYPTFDGLLPVADSVATFDEVQVDAAGWIWARIFEWDSRLPVRWLVFDPDGRAHGTVELPSGLRVEQIGEDFVLGTWRDDLRVEYVRRHRLER